MKFQKARAGRVGIGVLVLAALAVFGTGCQLAAPSFEVVDVAMTEETADGYVLTFVLEGENKNKEALPLREVGYRLSLDGKTVFSGERSAQATLPAKGSQRFTLPVSIMADLAPEGTRTYRLSGEVTYLAPGSIAEILFDSKIKRPKVGFGETGTFEFAELEEPVGPEVPGS